MMRSRLLLPAPLAPSTPILAPGRKATEMSDRITRSPETTLPTSCIVYTNSCAMCGSSGAGVGSDARREGANLAQARRADRAVYRSAAGVHGERGAGGRIAARVSPRIAPGSGRDREPRAGAVGGDRGFLLRAARNSRREPDRDRARPRTRGGLARRLRAARAPTPARRALAPSPGGARAHPGDHQGSPPARARRVLGRADLPASRRGRGRRAGRTGLGTGGQPGHDRRHQPLLPRRCALRAVARAPPPGAPALSGGAAHGLSRPFGPRDRRAARHRRPDRERRWPRGRRGLARRRGSPPARGPPGRQRAAAAAAGGGPGRTGCARAPRDDGGVRGGRPLDRGLRVLGQQRPRRSAGALLRPDRGTPRARGASRRAPSPSPWSARAGAASSRPPEPRPRCPTASRAPPT